MDTPAPPIPPPANKTELLVSLRHLLRGLTALFWGLPFALLVCIPSEITRWLKPMNVVPSLLATGVLLFGVVEMARFRPQERLWQLALDRAKIFATVNLGLSPFIFYLTRLPGELYYRQMMWVMGGASLLYLFNVNRSLKYLALMLPDQTLREDTALFTSMNHGLMITLLALVGAYFGLRQLDDLPLSVIRFLVLLEQQSRWLLIFLVLLPVAMTMSLLWKIKEIVLTGIFGGHA